ncbi:DnaJ-class molecular chaperone [Streptacidiphilus sp. MAP12-16]|uniref:hypothetical protein n=1 Tax=Streptacidiphilus sp. MAP12-16 TaxID=3156300 RepID=UPI0035163050
MMPQLRPALRVCPTCDGFPVVAVAIGPRRTDGTLPTLPVTCPDCHGVGTRPAPVRPVLALIGR